MSNKRKAPGGAANLNADLSDMLLELGQFEKNRRVMHKYSAYRKAAAAVANHPTKIASGAEAGKLPGIGKKIADKIDEFLSSGQLASLNKIRKDDRSVAVAALTRVSGLGPVLANLLIDQHAVSTVPELRGSPEALSLLSPAQRIGLDHLEDFERRIPRDEVALVAERVRSSLAGQKTPYRVEAVGSFRRGLADSGDVDLLLTHPHCQGEPEAGELDKVVSALGSLIVERISCGRRKFMGVYRLEPADKSPFRRIDLTMVPVDEWSAALTFFTGSDEFVRQLRVRANAQGLAFNEHSLRRRNHKGEAVEVIPTGSEEEVLAKIGLPWTPPVQRNF